jgi:hypothetical protein
MSTATLMFDVFLTILLTGIGGLMAVLYMRVRALTQAEQTLPTLSDQFLEAIQRGRDALRDMGDMAQARGTELDDKVFVAERALQDLTYMLDRAEKVLQKMDVQLGMSTPSAPIQASRPVETTAARPQPEQPTMSEAALRRRKSDAVSTDAVVMPGRQTPGRRMSAQSQIEQSKQPAFRPSTRQGSAAAYAAMGAETVSAGTTHVAVSDVERDLRRALEETL